MTLFRPLPLLGNPHVQTILGNLWKGAELDLPVEPRIVELPDGDRIVLQETPPQETSGSARMVLLVHGLGGCARSAYMKRMTRRLTTLGWRVFRMNLRGAGDGLTWSRRFYNAACSQDVHAVVNHLSQIFPETPLAVVGFSLGGNIVLKFAGELGTAALPEVRCVAALAPPIDLLLCSERIARYPFYDSFYVRHLTRQVDQHQRCFSDLPRIVFPNRCTLWQFDEMYTAPRWGYTGAGDYYRQASSLDHLGAIRVPTFILTARDDPFVAVQPFDALPTMPSIEVHITAHGGHLGFLGKDETGGIRWGETQIVNWLTKQM